MSVTKISTAERLALQGLLEKKAHLETQWKLVLTEAGLDPEDSTLQIDLETGEVKHVELPVIDASATMLD